MPTFYQRISDHLPYSPEDFVAARVHRLLSHDANLSAVLDGRIIYTRNPEDIDYTVSSGPIMHIAPHLSEEPVETTGFRELRTVEVIIALLWEEVEWVPVYDGPSPDPDTTVPGTSVGTVLDYCWHTVAKPANRGLWETVAGEQIQTVSPGYTNRRTHNLTPFQKTETGPTIYGQLLILRFRVNVDVRTGKIENISQLT